MHSSCDLLTKQGMRGQFYRVASGTALLLTAAMAGCRDAPVEAAAPETPATPAISDAVHMNGRPHFFFLPPMVSAPAYQGVFDATLSPSVTICEYGMSGCGSVIATFTMLTGSGSETVQVDPTAQQYSVNWHTSDFGLDPAKTYRIWIFEESAVGPHPVMVSPWGPSTRFGLFRMGM